ncbi:MAG: nicotinate-nucleotide adenylyltransferase [Bacteroidota bacterium]|nr:nicotinate-nucleotide adenylyltransferase [Bacteroidota bacterium]
MKYGLFGGTFNPPHIGHLIVIESVRNALKFDKIFFIPSAQPPNKPGMSLAPPSMRYEMTKLAIQGNVGFDVSDIEIKRQGLSYTIDTLEEFVARYPKADFSLIIGADNLLEFETWKAPDEIITKADLVVMSRPDFPIHNIKRNYSRHAQFLNVPSIGISSTDIRRRVKMGRSIRYLVPLTVEQFIHHKGLYKE